MAEWTLDTRPMGSVDLTWVERTQVINGDNHVSKKAIEDNPGWHLLYVTGGLHGPVQFVYGWGDPPSRQDDDRVTVRRSALDALAKCIDHDHEHGNASARACCDAGRRVVESTDA